MSYAVERVMGNIWRICDYNVGADEDVVVGFVVGTRADAHAQAEHWEQEHKKTVSSLAPRVGKDYGF